MGSLKDLVDHLIGLLDPVGNAPDGGRSGSGKGWTAGEQTVFARLVSGSRRSGGGIEIARFVTPVNTFPSFSVAITLRCARGLIWGFCFVFV